MCCRRRASTTKIMSFIGMFLTQLQPLVRPSITLVYPAYASLQALESPFQEDDHPWLTYWSLYSSLSFVQTVLILNFPWLPVPLLEMIKFVACCWLLFPPFQGARFIYLKHICGRNRLGEELKDEVRWENLEQATLDMMKPRTQEAAIKFIENNGQDTFEKLMQVAVKGAIKNKPKTPRNVVRIYLQKRGGF
ncbi:protein HVA22 [Selaginella moellendorffii]|uniref:protein HVA22 n=1 Tax=Selaginella moellendorffii TaxID=88036 RepID=UPI000D1C99DB|nr:protein HVA22 [Selaginella moellendorffii]|eukprot:XP_024540315.1 protein HVA22 [Selaginella moellendorffii]